ncbi:pheA operon leader peptide PheL [Kosakonia oryzae]|nr:pheA operon leader peptide PheL [Kosakonia oryzae]UDJ85027.1 pheA operon leader peptide PheL [Kosakonia oryzae]
MKLVPFFFAFFFTFLK